jgi:carbamoyl-phosphate synthase large subunit
MFVKPRIMGRASIDAFRVDSPAQLRERLQSIQQPLIQSLVTGQEYTVDLLCDFQGKVVNGVVRQRIETKSGVSYKGATVAPGTILQDAVQIAEKLPIVGPANLQCIVQHDKNYFIDINPRFSGALVLSIAAGFNSPLELVRLSLGQETRQQIGHYQVGVRMFRYWEEVFVYERDRRPLWGDPGAVNWPTHNLTATATG